MYSLNNFLIWADMLPPRPFSKTPSTRQEKPFFELFNRAVQETPQILHAIAMFQRLPTGKSL